jgi:hypothetical protein
MNEEYVECKSRFWPSPHFQYQSCNFEDFGQPLPHNNHSNHLAHTENDKTVPITSKNDSCS